MLKHWYHKWDTVGGDLYSTKWLAQSFTPDASFSCSALTIFATRAGTPTGTLTVAIYAADGSGNPTGAALASASCDYASVFGYASSYFVRNPLRFDFSSPAALTASTQYVFVLSISGSSAGNSFTVAYLAAGDYSGGNMKTSSDSGGSWSDTAYDMNFDLWDASDDGTSYMGIDAQSTSYRMIEIHKGTLGSTITRAYGFQQTSGRAFLVVQPSHIYTMVGGSIMRWTHALVRDTTWGAIGYSGIPVSFDVQESSGYLGFATSSQWRTYTIASKTQTAGETISTAGCVCVHSTLDRAVLTIIPGSGGYWNITQYKASDGSLIVNQWVSAINLRVGCYRETNGRLFVVNNNTTGYKEAREYLTDENTYVWTLDIGTAIGACRTLVHDEDDQMLWLGCELNSSESLYRIVDSGSGYAAMSTGGAVYGLFRTGEDWMACGPNASDGIATSPLRFVDKDTMEISWRFDGDITGPGSSIYAAVALLLDEPITPQIVGRGDFLIEATVGPDPDPIEDVVIPLDTTDYFDVYPLCCRPETPLIEHLLFDTQISMPLSGIESRSILRHIPRIQFELILADKRQRMESILFGQAMDYMGVPFWHEPVFLTTAAKAIEDHVHVTSTAYSQFLAGQWAFIVSRDCSMFEVKKIETVADTQITFTSPLENNYRAKAEVLPLSRGWIQSATVDKQLDYAKYSIKTLVEPVDNDLDVSPYINGTLSLTTVNYGQGLRETVSRPTYPCDSNWGLVSQTVGFDRSLKGSVLGFRTSSRASLWALRRMLYQLAGRAISFNLATFAKELIPATSLVLGSTALNIEYCGYTDFVQNRRGTLRVVLTDETIIERSVLTSQILSSTLERITVDSAWGSTIPISDIERIEYVDRVRFDSDDIVIRHQNALGFASCDVPVKFLITE